MSVLTGESVCASLEGPSGDDTPSDARAESHEHEVVAVATGSESPLGQRAAGGVVIDPHGLIEACTKQTGHVEVGDTVKVGSCAQDAGVGDQTRHSDTDRDHRTDAGLDIGHHRSEGVDEKRETARAPWGWLSGLVDDRSGIVENHSEALRATNIDTETEPVRHEQRCPGRSPGTLRPRPGP